jgi:ABC-2 type transport system permease protein
VSAGVERASLAAPRYSLSLWSRLYGFGSVYAKTVRDSRLAFLIVAGLMGGIMLAVGYAIASVYATQESRDAIARVATDVSAVAQGFSGKPVNVGTMGGYVQWKYGPVFLWIAALWSIMALSSTLAAEARDGSLEFVATSPVGKRRIAFEKVAAHLTAMTGVLVILAVAAWLAGAAFGTLPGDEVPWQAAVGFALWVGLLALAFGGVAFALAPFLGRGAAAGIAGSVLFAGRALNGYQATVPAFRGIADLTPLSWTADHLPLAGRYDWGSLLPVAIVAVVLLAVGIEAFARRDLGAATAIRTPGPPAVLLGLRGPVGRAFSERLPVALAWGLGLGLFGLVMASISRWMADEVTKSPDLDQVFRDVLPGVDMTTAGGFLQFAFVQLGFIVVGFAAATLVAGWASDETSGRLELLLATPLGRGSWAVLSGLGVYAAIATLTVILALAVGAGAASAGSDALTPMGGSVTLGLYAAAVTGVGIAIGGVFRTSIAAETVALLVGATFLIDLLAPALNLPAWVHHLALTAHLGRPMVGEWDGAGIAACVLLAVGGLLIGGWGMQRRDVAR